MIAGAIAAAGAAAGAVLAVAEHTVASLLATVMASFGLIVLSTRSTAGFNTLLAVFAGFHVVYGLSGPIADVFGAPLPSVFSTPYETDAFLLNYSLATLGFALGVLLLLGRSHVDEPRRRWATTPRALGGWAVFLGMCASAMEMVNFIRVGGLATVLQGKELYQGLVSDLVLDLPSHSVAMLSTATMGLAFSASRLGRHPLAERVTWIQVAAFTAAVMPLLVPVVLLGQRSPLLSWILIALVSVTYHTRVKRIGRRFVALATAVYLLMGFIYVNRSTRGAALSVGDWSAILRSAVSRQAVARALNPAANEFGITLGNFSEYVKSSDHELGLGKSYAIGLLLPVPALIYPGNKPQQVSYTFRDRVFPGEAERGAIVGTAYSSILEAHYNFRELGVTAVYFLAGVLLVLLEHHRARSRSLSFALMYALAVPVALLFHRSAFADSVISLVALNGAMVAVLWIARSFVAVACRRP